MGQIYSDDFDQRWVRFQPTLTNPRSQVPVLDDDGTIIWDSMAILVYIARKYGSERWLPLDAAPTAEVMQWLGVMENETLYGLGKARIICKFKFPGSLEEAQTLGRKAWASWSSGFPHTIGSRSII